MKNRTLVPMVTFSLAILLASSAGAQSLSHEVDQLPLLKNYTVHRASSFDRTGANDDGNWKEKIKPGETRTLAELVGPGVITHIWITIATAERYHLKKLILRMYWDGEAHPSVEAPVGDFFGLGLGEYFLYESALLSVGSQKALNCFIPMPFRRSAKITVTHEGGDPVGAFYFNIDYQKHKSLPENLAYFHAQYRQAAPNKGWTNDWKLNGDDKVDKKEKLQGEGNYLTM